MNDITFPENITKKEFFRELDRAKKLIDHGIRDYFILADTKSFLHNTQLGNTTLKDIENVFGKGYLESFRFGYENPDGGNEDDKNRYMTYSIRHITKGDKRKLRDSIRFFPADCWVIDWRDADRAQLIVPFIQGDAGEITYLHDVPLYRVDGKQWKKISDMGQTAYWKKAIEDMPDYFTCLFACVQYKHTHCVIPLPADSAKATFKEREKDADGVKRRLVHKVNQHKRHTTKGETDVTDHLRGTSLITIDGVDVTLMTSFEWSSRYLKQAQKNQKQNEKDFIVHKEVVA